MNIKKKDFSENQMFTNQIDEFLDLIENVVKRNDKMSCFFAIGMFLFTPLSFFLIWFLFETWGIALFCALGIFILSVSICIIGEKLMKNKVIYVTDSFIKCFPQKTNEHTDAIELLTSRIEKMAKEIEVCAVSCSSLDREDKLHPLIDQLASSPELALVTELGQRKIISQEEIQGLNKIVEQAESKYFKEDNKNSKQEKLKEEAYNYFLTLKETTEEIISSSQTSNIEGLGSVNIFKTSTSAYNQIEIDAINNKHIGLIFAALVNELYDLGKYTNSNGKAYSRPYKIGGILNDAGGKLLMQAAFLRLNGVDRTDLSRCWNGIGEWQH